MKQNEKEVILTKEEFKDLYMTMKIKDLAAYLGVGINKLIDTAKSYGISKSNRKRNLIIEE